MKNEQKITKNDKKIAIELYKKGIKCKEIGKIYGVKELTVAGWIRKAGVVMNIRKKEQSAKKDDAIKLHYKGYSELEISKMLELDYSTVNKWLKQIVKNEKREIIDETEYSNEIVEEIARMLPIMSIKQIQCVVELDEYAIEKIIKDYNLKKRTRRK